MIWAKTVHYSIFVNYELALIFAIHYSGKRKAVLLAICTAFIDFVFVNVFGLLFCF